MTQAELKLNPEPEDIHDIRRKKLQDTSDLRPAVDPKDLDLIEPESFRNKLIKNSSMLTIEYMSVKSIIYLEIYHQNHHFKI